MNVGLRHWLLPLILLASSFLLDLSSKNWVRANLEFGHGQSFIPGILNLIRTTNTGGAFGIGRGHAELMTILAAAIVLAIGAWAFHRERSASPLNALERCGIGTILGGALGNLFDRMVRGEVTDFLEFAFFQFPVFNVADVLIDVGAGLVILGALSVPQKSDHSPKPGPEDESSK